MSRTARGRFFHRNPRVSLSQRLGVTTITSGDDQVLTVAAAGA
jgi:hypothetical protein